MRKIVYNFLNMNLLTFDKQARRFVLDIFDKQVDMHGFVVEKNNPGQKVLTPDGEELEENQFAGVKKGSEIYIKSDILSLIKLYDSLQ